MTAAVQPGGAFAGAGSYNYELQCVAGFFDSEAQAQPAALQLTQRQGLHKSRCLVLGP